MLLMMPLSLNAASKCLRLSGCCRSGRILWNRVSFATGEKNQSTVLPNPPSPWMTLQMESVVKPLVDGATEEPTKADPKSLVFLLLGITENWCQPTR